LDNLGLELRKFAEGNIEVILPELKYDIIEDPASNTSATPYDSSIEKTFMFYNEVKEL